IAITSESTPIPIMKVRNVVSTWATKWSLAPTGATAGRNMVLKCRSETNEMIDAKTPRTAVAIMPTTAAETDGGRSGKSSVRCSGGRSTEIGDGAERQGLRDGCGSEPCYMERAPRNNYAFYARRSQTKIVLNAPCNMSRMYRGARPQRGGSAGLP